MTPELTRSQQFEADIAEADRRERRVAENIAGFRNCLVTAAAAARAVVGGHDVAHRHALTDSLLGAREAAYQLVEDHVFSDLPEAWANANADGSDFETILCGVAEMLAEEGAK